LSIKLYRQYHSTILSPNAAAGQHSTNDRKAPGRQQTIDDELVVYARQQRDVDVFEEYRPKCNAGNGQAG
jgi:hypothetical protein